MHKRILLSSISLLAALLISKEVSAQSVNTGLQPPTQEAIEDGVDMISGSLVIQQNDLSLGQQGAPNQMELNRTYRSSSTSGTGWGSFDEWEHNYKIYAINPLGAGTGFFSDVDVIIGQESHSFSSGYTYMTNPQGTPGTPGVYVNLNGDGSTLTMSGTSPNIVLSFTSKDGDIITFQQGIPCSYVTDCMYASRIDRSDGSKIYLNYGPAGNLTANNPPLIVNRLRWVTNSFGYGFQFIYVDEGTTSVTSQSRLTVSTVNGVKTACPSSPTSCSATILSSASYQYQSANLILGSVNAAGNSRTFTYDSTYGTLRSSFQAAYPSNPEFTAEWAPPPTGYGQGGNIAVSKKTDSAGFATIYSWTGTYGNDLTYKATNAQGSTTSYRIWIPYARTGDRPVPWLLGQVTDAAGGVTAVTYDPFYRITKIQYPEGNSVSAVYDARGNVTTRTLTAKASASATDIVQSASFPSACTAGTAKTCNKPIFVVDANNNRTNYSWSTLHGGLESQVGGLDINGNCALATGVCPQTTQTFSSYTTPDGAAVYLLASRVKRLDAANSSTDTFGYSSSQSYALNKATVDAGGANLVTCYLYDGIGNQIAKTLPRAGQATCQ